MQDLDQWKSVLTVLVINYVFFVSLTWIISGSFGADPFSIFSILLTQHEVKTILSYRKQEINFGDAALLLKK